jgi:predicted nucleic acid-binding protein
MEKTSGSRTAVTGFVLDSSIALSWCFEDEASAGSDALFERVRDDGAVVPGLWHLELGNVLLQAEKRGRISPADVATRLDLIAELPISVDPETGSRAWREVLTLARAQGLTTYDAAYLELAARRGLPLATKDQQLAAAATRLSVVVLRSQ